MSNIKTKCKTGYFSTSLATWGSSWVSREAKFIKDFDFLGFSRCFSLRIEQSLKKTFPTIALFGSNLVVFEDLQKWDFGGISLL